MTKEIEKQLETLRNQIEASQQASDPEFGAGVSLRGKWFVVPNSSLAEDQLLAVEVNKELRQLCVEHVADMHNADAAVLRSVLNQLHMKGENIFR